MKKTSWLAAGVLAALVAVMVYSSLGVGGVRCEVCIRYRGQEACRTVDGETEEEALRAAMTTACAPLATGVTDTLACERTAPTSSECRAL